MRNKFLFIILILFFYSISFPQQDTPLLRELKSFKELSDIQKIDVDSNFTEAYEMNVLQPVDHNNPAGDKFKQRIYFAYKNDKAPVVFDTEGYDAERLFSMELTKILNANQIIVEHRYFGKSVPSNKQWKYLNIKQAAADHHAIVEIFKRILKGKWISTGISKGGQTTLFFKRFYPNDVDAAVPYVAPVNLAQEDPRIYMFLNSVGTEECRNKIKQFQRAFLTKREEILPLLLMDVEKNNIRLAFDPEFTLEYMTLEYSFAFWQWGASKCDEIPSPDASAEELYNHMRKSNPIYFFTEQAIEDFGAFYVQAYNEIGYYGYDLSPFKDLLTEIKDGSNIMLVPKDAKIHYDCEVMQDINTWLQKHGDKILYIYGGNDTWSATSIQLTGECDAVKMVKKGGSHATRIKNFDGKQKEQIYSTLERWLGIEIPR